MDQILSELLARVDGARAAAVGSRDGLLVEQWPQGGDLAALVAEQAGLLQAAGAARHRLGGELTELILQDAAQVTFLRPIGAQLFLLVLLGLPGNLGQLRWFAPRAAERLAQLVQL
jgi:predicted regulator of Ras-like GTPase activity (Roadblock/LC7/MglB family)